MTESQPQQPETETAPDEPRAQAVDPLASVERDAPESVRRFSLAGKVGGLLAVAIVVFVALMRAAQEIPWEQPFWLDALLAFAVVFPLTVWGVHRITRPFSMTVQALSDGILSFSDRDFSVRIASRRNDELGHLVRLYNRVGETLQDERGQLRQRELLLQSALDQSPIAIVLVNALERVLYANLEARRLFLGGGRLAGHSFLEILEACPAEMREVLDTDADGIFSVENAGQAETYHVAQRTFLLNRQRHRLYLLRRMTSELGRQEAEIWKKVIRIISHELNNSLAPISSLAHSAAIIASRPDSQEKLESVFDTIRERVDYLTRFLEGYARFARLPKPRKQRVRWSEWLEGPAKLYEFEIESPPGDAEGFFDPSQLQQVLINLLKNAVEASEELPEISVRVDLLADGSSRATVADRGRGMNDDVMRKALLPFYSTKHEGTGVGLPLCREIIEAHGGSLRIQNRDGGGTVISFWLPAAPPDA